MNYPTTRRFWTKIDRRPETEGGCWLWTANKTPAGYGQYKFNYRTYLAHRFSYELLVGPIPDGLHLDHLCRVRNCVNPAHLEPVTCRVNLLRGETFQARNARKTHCGRGHEFSSENTRINPKDGARVCRTCARENSRRHYRGQALNAEPARVTR